MKKTGIKVWVLTGDKIETAMNIGVSAGLLDDNMDKYIIEEDAERWIEHNLKQTILPSITKNGESGRK
jgi:phospholipid-transporting ATPase